jgi:tetratricopeptide (TPR) repeat protein
MTPLRLGGRINAVLDRFRYARTVLLPMSLLAGAALLYLGVVAPLIQQFNRASIPAFPDYTGQPAPVVEYLKTRYTQALDRPASDEAVGRLGMAYHAHLIYDVAAACYERAGELNPKEWKWTYYAALIHEELGDARNAIDGFRNVVEKQPAFSHAWFRLGNAYLKTQSFQDADSAFRQVMKLPEETSMVIWGVRLPAKGAFPLKAYAMLQLARIQFLQKRYADSQLLLEEVTSANPSFGPAYRLLGNVYQDLGEGEKAADCEVRAGDFDSYVPPADALYNALVLSSRNTDFITRQINIAVKWENYEWCVTLINHILEYSPHDGEALTFKIKLALDTQNINELEPLVIAYIEQFKSDESKLLDMAKYLRLRGEYEASVALLRDIISLNPKAIEAHIEFVRMLQTFKQYDLGFRYCTEVIAKEPQNAQIRLELTDFLIHMGRLNEAEEELKAAEKIHPDDEMRSIMMGRISEKKGNVRDAVRFFQKALAANPRNSATQLELGKYFQKARTWGEAAEHWQRALQASPNNIDFIEQFALLLAACPDARIRDGRKALELSERLRLVKKQTLEQDVRCAMALSASYAEMQQYDVALSVARDYLERSRAFRKGEYTGQLQVFVNLFGARKPYRL